MRIRHPPKDYKLKRLTYTESQPIPPNHLGNRPGIPDRRRNGQMSIAAGAGGGNVISVHQIDTGGARKNIRPQRPQGLQYTMHIVKVTQPKEGVTLLKKYLAIVLRRILKSLPTSQPKSDEV